MSVTSAGARRESEGGRALGVACSDLELSDQLRTDPHTRSAQARSDWRRGAPDRADAHCAARARVWPRLGTGADIPSGWMEISSADWSMIVPLGWRPDAVAYPYNRYALVAITRPSETERREMVRTPLPPTPFRPLDVTEPPYDIPRPYLTLGVSQSPREGKALEETARRYHHADCLGCDVTSEPRPFDVRGRPGIRVDAVGEDGWRHWRLIVQNECTTYVARIRAVPERAAEFSDTVERILASVRVRSGGKLIGGC